MLTQPETKAISPKKINKHFHKKFERRFVLSTAARHSIRLAIIIIVKGFKKLSKKTVIRSSLLRKHQTYDAMQPDQKIHKLIRSSLLSQPVPPPHQSKSTAFQGDHGEDLSAFPPLRRAVYRPPVPWKWLLNRLGFAVQEPGNNIYPIDGRCGRAHEQLQQSEQAICWGHGRWLRRRSVDHCVRSGAVKKCALGAFGVVLFCYLSSLVGN